MRYVAQNRDKTKALDRIFYSRAALRSIPGRANRQKGAILRRRRRSIEHPLNAEAHRQSCRAPHNYLADPAQSPKIARRPDTAFVA
jgi:hypothetical protein